MKDFIDFVKADCEQHSIKFTLSGLPYVQYGDIRCNGYFDAEEKELAVADGKDAKMWHATLVHEYGHMTQWKDQCEPWVNSILTHGICTETIIDLWLAHRVQLTRNQIKDYVSRSRAVEVDCEWRTVDLIKDHNLPIDIIDYIKRANAYMYFWTTIKKTRKWYQIGKEPYNNDGILELMPDELYLNDFYDRVPDKVRELMLECI